MAISPKFLRRLYTHRNSFTTWGDCRLIEQIWSVVYVSGNQLYRHITEIMLHWEKFWWWPCVFDRFEGNHSTVEVRLCAILKRTVRVTLIGRKQDRKSSVAYSFFRLYSLQVLCYYDHYYHITKAVREDDDFSRKSPTFEGNCFVIVIAVLLIGKFWTCHTL